MVRSNEFDRSGGSDPKIDQSGGKQLKGDTLTRFIRFLRLRSQRINVENASPEKIKEVIEARKDFPAASTTGPISKN